MIEVDLIARSIIGLITTLRHPFAHHLVPRVAELVARDFRVVDGVLTAGDLLRADVTRRLRAFRNADTRVVTNLVGRREFGAVPADADHLAAHHRKPREVRPIA